jgi:uncharacterized protein involved in exopolysaccharide biosynthesis
MDGELEIDLRKVIRSLLRRWMWIVGVAILAGVVAFGVTYSQSRLYEASAIVTLRRPLYQPNFDSRYQTLGGITLTSKVASDIAKSDEIVETLYKEWKAAKKTDVKGLKEKVLSTKSGEDQSVVYLIVRLEDAAEAARMANLWARLLVQRLNQIYTAQTQQQIEYFKQQLEVAQSALERSQNDLVDFEQSNQIDLLTNRLNSLFGLQNELERRLRLIEYVRRDTNTLLGEYASLPADQVLASSERNKLLFLQLRVYADSTSTTLSPIQFQLSATDAQSQNLTVAEMRQEIQSWLKALDAQAKEISVKLSNLNEEVFDLQYQIASQKSLREILQRNKEFAFDTFTVISRKYQEVLFSTQDESTDVARVGSEATIMLPAPRGTLRNTALATLLGGFLSVFGVLVWDWWRSEEEVPAPAREETLAREPVAAVRR